MSILSLIESSTGNTYQKKSNTRGGEYSGPCPWCNGDDRFSIHSEQNHFVCRKCHKAGDSIAFTMDYHQKTYMEACEFLNIQPNINFSPLDPAKETPGQNDIRWSPREIKNPPMQWQDKAGAVLFEAYKYLLSPSGATHRKWLNSRGISDNTIKIARLGWNTQSLSFSIESWGLPSEKSKTGKNKQIWVPEGLIIPYFDMDKPVRLRIRQKNPISTDRFILVSGSQTGFFNYQKHAIDFPDLDKPFLITESELDGWLLYQELSDKFNITSVGNSSARPDKSTHELISNQKILLNLDNDNAGISELLWWTEHYPGQIMTHYSCLGKDPGEDFEDGINIREWGIDGLKMLNNLKISIGKNKSTKQSFKDKVFQDIKDKKVSKKSVIPIKKPAKKIVKKDFSSTICVHNQWCGSLSKMVCLVDKSKPFLIMKCPNKKWYTHTTGHIIEIILGIGMRKKRY